MGQYSIVHYWGTPPTREETPAGVFGRLFLDLHDPPLDALFGQQLHRAPCFFRARQIKIHGYPLCTFHIGGGRKTLRGGSSDPPRKTFLARLA
jgi:hypothetical protein